MKEKQLPLIETAPITREEMLGLSKEPEFLNAGSDEWETPYELYGKLHLEFGFDLDVAASAKNSKCPKFITKELDALKQDWAIWGRRIWCNPPYSAGNCAKFAYKCAEQTKTLEGIHFAVLLIPTKTEQPFFHQLRTQYELRFVRGRQKFIGGKTSGRDSHMLMIFRNPHYLVW